MANMGQAPLRKSVKHVQPISLRSNASNARRSSQGSDIPKLPSIKKVKDEISVASSLLAEE